MKTCHKSLTCAVAAVLAFFALEIVLIAFVDRPLSQYIRMLDPSIIDIFRDYTRLGKSDIYLWPSGIALLGYMALAKWQNFPEPRRKELWQIARTLGFFFLCVGVSGIVGDILKLLIGRARPLLLEREDLYAFAPFTFHMANYQSMPSGHATTAFAVAAALSLIWPRGKIAFFVFAAAVSLSRIMVNAHFLSDVVAGAALGLITVECICMLFRRRGWKIIDGRT